MDTGIYRIHKFSSKPPGHDAARQRENQRRHRARVKGRIAELEELLSASQNRLDDALKRIETLTAEVHQLQHGPSPSSTPSTQTTQQPPLLEPETYPELEPFDETVNGEIAGQTLMDSDATLTPPTPTYPETRPTTPEPSPFVTQEPPTPNPQLLSELPASNVPLSGFEDSNDDCALLPPPSPGESTILCREAYSIIKDRSPPEFDLSTAAEWLLPGFRCAVVPGTGCRVQTHILFAFVDHITPM
ncbi:hypothetical protein F5144DRAFT_494420 [Chaetomium tenue]|uniref:Uncharacterized protein n=1 Tax=Chaetomium tenue TaxID=1854479 RepID=A0ACB7P875_9PEZI|nr:hypothetical protein F5144DRAFT_494420 [Chaetomium globosum]